MSTLRKSWVLCALACAACAGGAAPSSSSSDAEAGDVGVDVEVDAGARPTPSLGVDAPIEGAVGIGTPNPDAIDGVLYEPDPANTDEMASYPHAIRLSHGGAANGTILATFERQLQKSARPGRGFLIHRSTDGGAHFELLGAPVVPAHFADATSALQPALLELAHPSGALTEGTLLLAGLAIGDGGKFEAQLFRSDDHGASWTFASVIESADVKLSPRRIWEPYLLQLDDGRLVAYYSDELTPGGRQNIARKVSADGGKTWSPQANAWASAVSGDRPGMVTVARIGAGRYVMSVEMCGAPGDFCRAHIKTSDDGLDWGTGPADMGMRVLSTVGHPLHGTPFIAWSPAGGAMGTLILSGRALMHSVSEPGTAAGGFGQTLFVNHGGGVGDWHELTAPVPWHGGATDSQAGYRNALLPSADGRDLLYFATSYAGEGVRNRILYASANAGVLPYRDPFPAGNDVGWQTFGGAWSLADGVYSASAGPGYKSVAGSTDWSDYTLEGDVRLTASGNAGFIVRVNDPSVGVDAASAYYAGLSSADGTLFLGRQRYDWTPIGAGRPVAGGVAVGAWYHVSVKAAGCAFTLTASAAIGGAATTFTENDPGCARNGAIGVRTFVTGASWRKVTVTAASP